MRCLAKTLTLTCLAVGLGSGAVAATPGAATPLPAAAAPVAGNGLQARVAPEAGWPSWQARLALATPSVLAAQSWDMSGLSPASMHHGAPSGTQALLAGDHYLGWGAPGSAGGLRATGAVMFGSSAFSLAAPGIAEGLWRPAAAATGTDTDAMPYLGLGYSAWWARTGIGLSADLGIAAGKPAEAARFGRVLSGSESLDETLRAMRLSPVFQVNLSYAF